MNDNKEKVEVVLSDREQKIKDMVDSMLKPFDFVTVINDSMEEFDLPKGGEAIVAATQAVPCDEEDIYNLRMHIVVHPIKGDHVDSSYMILIDPKNVELMPVKRAKKLEEIFILDFQTNKEVSN